MTSHLSSASVPHFGSIQVSLRREGGSSDLKAPLEFSSFKSGQPVAAFIDDNKAGLTINVGGNERYSVPLTRPDALTDAFTITKDHLSKASCPAEKLGLASLGIYSVLATLVEKPTPPVARVIDFVTQCLAEISIDAAKYQWIKGGFNPKNNAIYVSLPSGGPTVSKDSLPLPSPTDPLHNSHETRFNNRVPFARKTSSLPV